MFSSLCTAGAAEQTQTNAAQLAATDELLKFIGINPAELTGENVTRSTAAKLYCLTAGLGGIADGFGSDFTDIASDENRAYISEAFKMGWISAPSAESFNPSGEITVYDFAKGFVTLLGYREIARRAGGDIMLTRLGLTKGTEGGLTAALTVKNAVTVIENALDAPLVVQTVFGDSAEYKTDDDRTLLTEVHRLKTVEGVVNAVAQTSLYSAEGAGKGNIEIAKVSYKTDTDRRELLGRYVKAYIYTENGDEYVKAAVVNRSQTREENITLSSKIAVWTENGSIVSEVKSEDGAKTKKTKMKISTAASFIYNGSYDVDYKLRSLDSMKFGDISLIDYNSDGTYEVVSVNEYVNYHIKGIYDGKIFDSNGLPALDLKADSIEFLEIEKDGGEVALDSLDTAIGKNGTASVFMSADGRAARVVLSDISAFDEITAVKTEGGIELFRLEDGWYEAAVFGCPDYKLKLSDWGNFYFDAFGRISGAALKSDTVNYGYYAASKTDKIGTRNQFKILTRLGRFKVFDGAKKIKLNGVSKAAEDVVNTLGGTRQLISYKTNPKGEITAINTVGGEIKLVESVSATGDVNLGFRHSSQTFKSTYHVGSDTVIFHIDTEDATGNVEDDIKVMSTSSIRERVSCSYEVYDTDDMRVPGCIIMYNNLSKGCANEMWFVRETGSVQNSAGETIESVTCIGTSGRETTLYTNADTAGQIEPGTGIRVRYNKYGFIDMVDSTYTVFPKFNKKADSDFTNDFLDTYMFGDFIGVNGLASDCAEGQGVIERNGENMFLIKNSPYVYQYSSGVVCLDYTDERGNYFVKISPLDLKAGDRVYYIRSGDRMAAIVRR